MSSSFYQKGTFLRARHQRTLIKGATGGHIMTTVNNTKERKSANDRKAFFQPCCAPSPPPLLPHLCRSSTTSNLALLSTSTSYFPSLPTNTNQTPNPTPHLTSLLKNTTNLLQRLDFRILTARLPTHLSSQLIHPLLPKPCTQQTSNWCDGCGAAGEGGRVEDRFA